MRLVQIALLLFLASAASAEEYIQIIKRGVNIRVGPTTDSEVVGKARYGDIFQVRLRSGQWYGIVMFSGEYRYVYATLVQTVTELPPLPPTATRKQACGEIYRAQRAANAEARALHSNHFDRMIDLERLLTDRYELPIFHRHGIAPAHNTTLLTECVTKKW